MSEDFIVTALAAKGVGYCYKGQRRFFHEYWLDFKAHLETGTLASVLVATGDGNAITAVERLRDKRDG